MSRLGLEPLIGMTEQLLARAPGWEDTLEDERAATPSLAEDLQHLARHDVDGLITVSRADEVVAFGASFVRSRTLHIAHVWVLPEHAESGSARSLLRRLLLHGERAGANQCAALALAAPWQEALLFRFSLRPRLPVYRLALEAEQARALGTALSSALPGAEVTSQVIARRGWAGDVERLDRLVRGFVRSTDHEYWLTHRGLRIALVSHGKRVAGYAYGGPGQCGPVVASTGEAAMAALGWALRLAAVDDERVELLVPAAFEAAVEALLEAEARLLATAQWMSRRPPLGLDRSILASITLM